MSQISTTRGNPQASDVAVQTATPMLGGATREDLQTVVSSADTELAKLFEDRNITLLDGGTLTYTTGSPSQLSMTASLKLAINSQVAGGAPTVIDLASTTRSFSANGRMLYAVVNRLAGTAVITADSATLPAVTSANQEVVLLAKRFDGATERVYLRNGQSFGNAESSSLGTSSTTFSDTTFQIRDNSDSTKKIDFDAAGTTGTKTTIQGSQTTNRIITMPDATDTLVVLTASQVLTNKSLTAAALTGATVIEETAVVRDTSDATKTLGFNVGGTTGTQTTLTTNQTAARVVTLPDATTTLLGTNNTAVVTAKDIDGGTASNTSRITIPKDTLANITALTRKEGTILYATDTDKFYSDDGSVLTEVGSGSGSGELNEVLNPSASTGTTGWTNGTSHTISRVTTGSPLDPLVSTAFTVVSAAATAESSTSGSYYSISALATSLKSKKLKCEFYVVVPTSDVWRLSVYQSTTRLSLSTDSSAVTTLPAGFTGKFTAYFDTNTSAAYSVNFTKTTRAGSGNDLTFTNLIVGPGIQPASAAIGEWASFTPTFTNVTLGNSSVAARYRRVGDSIDLQYAFVFGSSGASITGVIKPVIPFSLTIDNTKKASAEQAQGWTKAYDSSAGQIYTGFVRTGGSYISAASTTPAAGDTLAATVEWKNNTPFTWAVNDELYFDVRGLPIAEWAGSGTLNVAQNDVEYASNSSTTDADDTTSFVYGPQGSLIPTITAADAPSPSVRAKTVRFQTPIQSTDQIILEVLQIGASTNQWVTVGQAYNYGQTQVQSDATLNIYGMGVDLSATVTDVLVKFGRAGRFPIGNGYATGGANWPDTAGDRWRVRKVKAGVAVGFGLADTTGNSGLVNPYSTNGVVYASTYTPTITGSLNVAATTPHVTSYMRVGNYVQVSGLCDIDPTAATTLTEFRISLPVASNLINEFELGGAGGAGANTILPLYIRGDITNDAARVQYYTDAFTGNTTLNFTFGYRIL